MLRRLDRPLSSARRPAASIWLSTRTIREPTNGRLLRGRSAWPVFSTAEPACTTVSERRPRSRTWKPMTMPSTTQVAIQITAATSSRWIERPEPPREVREAPEVGRVPTAQVIYPGQTPAIRTRSTA